MDIFRIVGTIALSLIGFVVVLLILFVIVFTFLAIRVEQSPPERKILLDTTFRGARIRYEKLAKSHVGNVGYQVVFWLNDKPIWSSGEEIEPTFRGTKHFVLPVHPEDLQRVITIRGLGINAEQPRLPHSSLNDITQYVVSSMHGNVMWLSPNDITREEFDLIGDFLETYYVEDTMNHREPLFYYNALVYADESLFEPRVYIQKTPNGERSITISLNGEAYYRQDLKNDLIFGQDFGYLDSTTKILYVQLSPTLSVSRLTLTKEEIESFTNANGRPLRERYTVEILPPESEKE